MASLVPGRIVWHIVDDPQGRNPKTRPIVILNKDPLALPDGGFLFGVCITSSVDEAPKEHCVSIPWHRDGKVLTRLRTEGVAVCTWIVTIEKRHDLDLGGLVPPKVLAAILAKVRQLNAPLDVD